MMRRGFLQLMGLGGVASFLSGCFGPDAQWHRKITVTVTTPHGEVTGSSVQAEWVEADNTPRALRLPEAGGAGIGFKGEAVVVELGNGHYLFALLKGPDTVLTLYPNPKDFVEAAKLVPDTKGVKELNPYNFPMLVTFGNINDPKSVKEVKPSDLAATFGSGYSLKSITLEITDEKVTEGVVEKVLPWLVGFKGRILSPDLRLGAGLHDASAVLPIEKLNRSNFLEDQQ